MRPWRKTSNGSRSAFKQACGCGLSAAFITNRQHVFIAYTVLFRGAVMHCQHLAYHLIYHRQRHLSNRNKRAHADVVNHLPFLLRQRRYLLFVTTLMILPTLTPSFLPSLIIRNSLHLLIIAFFIPCWANPSRPGRECKKTLRNNSHSDPQPPEKASLQTLSRRSKVLPGSVAWMWNPVLVQMRQEDQECEASLGYPVRPCLIINEHSRNPAESKEKS